MQFGSGKTTSYMFNPNCVPFLIERLDSAASRRTVAHSLLTVNIDVGIDVPQVMPCLDGTTKELPGGVEFGTNRFLVCDSIDYNPNYFSTPSQALVLQQVYQDFMFRYLQALPQALADGHPIAKDRVIISESYPGPFAQSSLSTEPNRFVPLAPPTYSDNLGARCYTLVPKPSLQPICHGALPPFGASSPAEWQPITELTYRDTLPVSLIEGSAYRDEPELVEGVSALGNTLIAKDIANSARSLPNLSLKYVSPTGQVRGYIIAYEGRPDSSVQLALRELGLPDDRILHVEDFATINRRGVEGGKLLIELCNRFNDHYVTTGDAVPLYVEARDETSFALLNKNLNRIATRLGKKLVLTSLGEFHIGQACMHRTLITLES